MRGPDDDPAIVRPSHCMPALGSISVNTIRPSLLAAACPPASCWARGGFASPTASCRRRLLCLSVSRSLRLSLPFLSVLYLFPVPDLAVSTVVARRCPPARLPASCWPCNHFPLPPHVAVIVLVTVVVPVAFVIASAVPDIGVGALVPPWPPARCRATSAASS
jgi:hypothetical protein